MQNFLIDVEQLSTGVYVANYMDGTQIVLDANTYHDAVLEADLIEPQEYA
jgi:hypothetical protein